MAIPAKIKKHLDAEQIKHDLMEHKTVYTAYDMAQTMKEKLEAIGKTLAIKADKKYYLIVVPANKRVNLPKLQKFVGAKKLSFIKESEMIKFFKVKPGAIAPFGKLYGVPVFVDKSLLKNKVVIVSAGSYTESIKMKVMDYINSSADELGHFVENVKLKTQTKPKVKKVIKKKAVKVKAKPKTVKRVAKKK